MRKCFFPSSNTSALSFSETLLALSCIDCSCDKKVRREESRLTTSASPSPAGEKGLRRARPCLGPSAFRPASLSRGRRSNRVVAQQVALELQPYVVKTPQRSCPLSGLLEGHYTKALRQLPLLKTRASDACRIGRGLGLSFRLRAGAACRQERTHDDGPARV